MSDTWSKCGGCCGLARRPEVAKRKAPRVVLAGTTGFAVRLADQFRRLGWDTTAAAVEELHAMVVRKNPTVVILPAETDGESGFLTCAKLRRTRPHLRVVLVGEPTPRAERFAHFAGAVALVPKAADADAVANLA